MGDDIDERIKELALEIEEKIAENEQRLAELPDFAPRSQRSKKMRRVTMG